LPFEHSKDVLIFHSVQLLAAYIRAARLQNFRWSKQTTNMVRAIFDWHVSSLGTE
jgi:hypothetical protein